jgi:glucosamine--fructose-6-phosphate aminotransferase (isomerizing)
MCGIFGVVGAKNAGEIILSGLKKLEYRGYDSAGIAFNKSNKFTIIKEEGKISKLENIVKKHKISSEIGIGHTRWATHGAPTKENAHPHSSDNICVVHNGIIENYQEIKSNLLKSKIKFSSQTDTEVIPFLIDENFAKNNKIISSLIDSTQTLKGSYALAVMFKNHDNLIALAKKGSPLIIGIGENQNYISSDFYSLADYTNKVIILDDDEFAIIYKNSYEIFDKFGKKINKEIKIIESKKNTIHKNGFEHFMLKEIFEQPTVIQETLETYVDSSLNQINLPNFNFDLTKIKKITIIACGTSYNSGLIAKYLFEEIANIEVEVDIASEFRYRNYQFRDDNLMIFISQSGETADTLSALKFAKSHNQKILSIVNVYHSSIAQLSDVVIRTVAGPEIGVASTKAYTAQISVLVIFAIHFANINKKISADQQLNLIKQLATCPHKIKNILDDSNIRNIKKIASSLVKSKQVLYIGRGISSVSSYESALKFRELTYINAQGIPAGELKHGTIAVIDKKTYIVVIGSRNLTNNLFEKTLSNTQEINARGGKIIFISDKVGQNLLPKMAKYRIETPEILGSIHEAIIPIIATQLLAYYVAYFKGYNIDQPRNLAKSVTVE